MNYFKALNEAAGKAASGLADRIHTSPMGRRYASVRMVEAGERTTGSGRRVRYQRFILRGKGNALESIELLSTDRDFRTLCGVVMYKGLEPVKTAYFRNVGPTDRFLADLGGKQGLSETGTFMLIAQGIALLTSLVTLLFMGQWVAEKYAAKRDEDNAKQDAEKRLNAFLFQGQNGKEAAFDAYKTLTSYTLNVCNGKSRGMIVYGMPGTGKCLGRGTPVLMYDGSVKAVEDVQVGDRLMGPDSQPRNVLSLASGVSPLYRVTPVKGDSYVVNDVHILSLKVSGKGDAPVNVTVGEYLAAGPSFQAKAKGWRTGVEFERKPTTVDPYFLGLWLGDGCKGRPSVTTVDSEIVAYLKEYAGSLGLSLNDMQGENGRRARTYLLSTNKRGTSSNPITNMLRDLGVLNAKRIPSSYLRNSREVRLQVLAGLIDTDGHLTCGGFEYGSTLEPLADDVVFLARSLGFAAYKTAKIGVCSYQGGKIPFDYFRVFISGRVSEVPTRLPRKQAADRRQIKDVLRTGISLEAIGTGEYFGFEIDRDRLFLLGDFTVTHNTHNVRRTLHFAGLQPEKDYVIVKGSSANPSQNIKIIYSTLYGYNGKIIVFDDFDSALEDANTVNLLKAALDSYPVRIVSMPDLAQFSAKDQPLPSRFEFTGRIIMITNKTRIDTALMSRTQTVAINFTPDEFERNIGAMLEFISPEVPASVKKEVFEYLTECVDRRPDIVIDFRRFSSMLDLRLAYPDEWKELCVPILYPHEEAKS